MFIKPVFTAQIFYTEYQQVTYIAYPVFTREHERSEHLCVSSTASGQTRQTKQKINNSQFLN
ncbi:hypothetical protein GCM10028827_23690 [Mucilaginibacter myungsuensis]